MKTCNKGASYGNSEPPAQDISPSTRHVRQLRALISRISSPLLPQLPSHIIYGKLRKFWTDNQPKVQIPIYPPRLLHFEVWVKNPKTTLVLLRFCEFLIVCFILPNLQTLRFGWLSHWFFKHHHIAKMMLDC